MFEITYVELKVPALRAASVFAFAARVMVVRIRDERVSGWKGGVEGLGLVGEG